MRIDDHADMIHGILPDRDECDVMVLVLNRTTDQIQVSKSAGPGLAPHPKNLKWMLYLADMHVNHEVVLGEVVQEEDAD